MGVWEGGCGGRKLLERVGAGSATTQNKRVRNVDGGVGRVCFARRHKGAVPVWKKSLSTGSVSPQAV